jgi:cytochrome bd-type quinol oxidase subunit 2
MAAFVYLLCFLTSSGCAALLFRTYRRGRAKLLFWASLCFLGLALNNLLLFVDYVLVPSMNLELWRASAALASIAVLLYGLVAEA